MPPPMPNPAKRMTAQPSRPVQRYRPGKAVAEEETSDEEDDGSSSSSAPEPAHKFQRPTFIRKSDRNNNTASASARLLPDLASSDHDQLAPEDMVNDADGLDPAAEHAAWRLRELKRLQRDREALVGREREIEELERRRNLTAEEREAEDRDFLAHQKQARDQTRGQARVLAKYHHKGAFFRGGDDAAEALAQRDLMGATFQDDVADKAALPEYMRVRDMSKLGKKGRTRYKDLKSEDTGRFGDYDRSRRWDGNERFLPDRDEHEDGRNGPRISGANASALGNRRTTTTATREDRSNSPHSPSRRKRGPDRHSPDWDRDKRRRVDAVS
ncbi:hypothetical protein DV736_g3380, partial [Chaetothyriales sp. CBS 134916]